MSSRAPINLQIGDRRVDFLLSIDNDSFADQNTLRCFREEGCCEPEIVHVMARVLRPGDLAIDVGANIGFFTLLLARLVGETGSVIAFEPTATSYSKLKENVRLNRFTNVSCMQQALWSKREERTLHQSLDSGKNSLARSPDSLGKYALVTTTLDAAVATPRFRLLKIDVEGAEEHVMYGASQLNPANVPFVLSELNDEALQRFDNTAQGYRRLMEVRGYETFLLHKNGAIPTMVPRKTELVQGNFQNINVLFSTPDHIVEGWPEVLL